jgi:putative ABC transport system permease protein
VVQDLRFALRSSQRQPGFFVVAILTLALGVALTTTIFSVADSLMLRPLPYPEADRLFSLSGAARAEGQFRVATAAGDHRAWRETRAFSSISTIGSDGFVAMAGDADVRRVRAGWVDEAFLPTLGVQPLLGRVFTADDCREGAPAAALIAHGLWQRAFGGDPAAVGRAHDVGGRRTQIVGVLPRGFLYPRWSSSTPGEVEILLPLIVPATHRFDHDRRVYSAIGRVSPDVGVADAQARLDAAQQSVRALYTARNVIPGAFDGVTMTPLLESLSSPAARRAVVFLFIAAFSVLAVAAVNVANMLLARGAERERELAVRSAIGASRARLVRLLLVESVAVGAAGGLLGLLLARLTFGLVLTQLPARLVGFRPPEMNVRAALFAAALALAVGGVFGLLPAIRLSRPRLARAVKDGAPAATRATGWTRDALIFVEIALAVMLVGGGALVLRSFVNVVRVDTGMDPRGVLTMQVTLPPRNPEAAVEDSSAAFRQVLRAAGAVQGVRAAALTDSLLMSGMSRGSSLSFADIDHRRVYTRGNWVSNVHVSPDYFQVVGVPIVRGQPFPDDVRGTDGVAIVAERLGRIAGVDPIGRELVSLQKDSTERYRVVGVVAESRERSLESDPMSTVYLPLTGSERSLMLLVRTDRPVAIAPAVRDAIRRVDGRVMVDQVRTLEELAYRSIAERRFNAFLYGTFSASALALSMIGIYGVVAYTVSRRTREIGIRVALGASPSRVVSFVTRRLIVALACGLMAGLAGLAALQTGLRALLFQLQPDDPATLGSALALMGLAAVAAAYGPARRATRVDPMAALRAE